MNIRRNRDNLPPKRKVLTLLLGQARFVCLDQLGSIVEFLDIVRFVPLEAVPSLAYEIFDGQAFTFSYCMLIKKAINFEGLMFVSITLYKHRGGLLWTGVVKQILGWVRSRLKLSYKKDRVDSPVTWYFEFVGQLIYLLNDLERADIMLGQLLSYTNRRTN